MYLRCGEQYRRRYLEGEKIPPGAALVKGGAVHKAAEVNFTQKITTHEDLPSADLEEAAAGHVDSTIAGEGLMLAPGEESQGMAKVRGHIVDRAVVLTRMFRERVAPAVQPVLVERFVRIELPGRPFDLNGRLDLVDDKDVIHDIKTATRRKNQDEVDRSDQLTYYYAAAAKETGRHAAGVALDVLIDKARPEVQHLTSTRGENDKRVFLNRLNAMAGGVAAGVFPPAPLGSWWCSPKWCGYFNSGCPFVNAERKAAAEANDFGP